MIKKRVFMKSYEEGYNDLELQEYVHEHDLNKQKGTPFIGFIYTQKEVYFKHPVHMECNPFNYQLLLKLFNHIAKEMDIFEPPQKLNVGREAQLEYTYYIKLANWYDKYGIPEVKIDTYNNKNTGTPVWQLMVKNTVPGLPVEETEIPSDYLITNWIFNNNESADDFLSSLFKKQLELLTMKYKWGTYSKPIEIGTNEYKKLKEDYCKCSDTGVRYIIKLMMDFYNKKKKGGTQNCHWGTYEFDIIWEKIIEYVLNLSKEDEIKIFLKKGNELCNTRKLIPDFKKKLRNGEVIVDAKYYNNWEDIINYKDSYLKQFWYKYGKQSKNVNVIENAMIFASNKEGVCKVGSIEMGVEKIELYTLNLGDAIKRYIYKLKQIELWDELKAKEEDEKPINIKKIKMDNPIGKQVSLRGKTITYKNKKELYKLLVEHMEIERPGVLDLWMQLSRNKKNSINPIAKSKDDIFTANTERQKRLRDQNKGYVKIIKGFYLQNNIGNIEMKIRLNTLIGYIGGCKELTDIVWKYF